MFLPPTIDIEKSENYILSIRIFSKGLQFAISDPLDGKKYCLRQTDFIPDMSILENLKRVVFELSFLSLEFKQTNVVFVTQAYDILPSELFEAKQTEKVYKMVHSEKASKILANQHAKGYLLMQYNVEKECYDFLIRNLFNPKFYSHTGLLLDFFENKGTAMGMTTKMVVYFHEGMFDIFCYRDTWLTHCITIEDDQVMSQVYYILKAWEQSNFNQLTDFIYIAGRYDNQVFVELNKYVKNVEIINAPREVYLWNEEAQSAPLDLLSLVL